MARPRALPALAAAWAFWSCAAPAARSFDAFAAASSRRWSRPYTATSTGRGSGRPSLVQVGARGGAAEAEAEPDSIEISGFSGFVVGLAILPHVINALAVAFNVSVGGASFALGPFGLYLISCVTSVGIMVWSIGSFVERGRGLPAGPFGLLGISEGLSYLASLGLVIAAVVSGTRGGGFQAPQVSLPSAPQISVPSFTAPDLKLPEVKAPSGIKVPDLKVPDFKAPDFKAPDFKAPDFKVPDLKADIKVPDIKVPEFKAPAFKAPEIKIPDVKVPEVKPSTAKVPETKAPEAKAKAPEVKAPEKKPEAKPEVKAAPKVTESLPDYDMLFD